MWAVLTITGRIEVLGKETESQVEMGTEGSVRGLAPSHSSRTKTTGNELRKRLGDVLGFLGMLYPSLWLGALAITTSLRETIFLGERAERSRRFWNLCSDASRQVEFRAL